MQSYMLKFSDPLQIKLVYCETERDFNQRVQRGEICVRSIDDIERNGFYFTDGNGLISKGLAQCIAQGLSVCRKR